MILLPFAEMDTALHVRLVPAEGPVSDQVAPSLVDIYNLSSIAPLIIVPPSEEIAIGNHFLSAFPPGWVSVHETDKEGYTTVGAAIGVPLAVAP